MNHDQQTAKIDGTTLPRWENLPSATLRFDLIKIRTNASDNYRNACANVTYRKLEIFNSDLNNLQSGFSAPFPTLAYYPSIKQYVLAGRIGFFRHQYVCLSN